MSTKIYNAYKVNKSVDISMVLSLLKKARKEYHNLVIGHLSERMDDHLTVTNSNNITEFIELIKDAMDKNENSTLNFKASVMTYPYRDSIYFQLFGLEFPIKNTIFGEILEPHCVDYHYQNQSDPWYCFLEGLDEDSPEYKRHEKEYEERKEVWEGIYGDDWKPYQVGFIYEIFSCDDVWMTVYDTQEKRRETKKNDNNRP